MTVELLFAWASTYQPSQVPWILATDSGIATLPLTLAPAVTDSPSGATARSMALARLAAKGLDGSRCTSLVDTQLLLLLIDVPHRLMASELLAQCEVLRWPLLSSTPSRRCGLQPRQRTLDFMRLAPTPFVAQTSLYPAASLVMPYKDKLARIDPARVLPQWMSRFFLVRFVGDPLVWFAFAPDAVLRALPPTIILTAARDYLAHEAIPVSDRHQRTLNRQAHDEAWCMVARIVFRPIDNEEGVGGAFDFEGSCWAASEDDHRTS
ncbi:hypothetical protein DFH11DRAFT_1731810 [Phellopilus nigrolimitatus]|nr:hypothetical protein DFH11DRAFT_1731810 [Phellopilus nigrolimitatus]